MERQRATLLLWFSPKTMDGDSAKKAAAQMIAVATAAAVLYRFFTPLAAEEPSEPNHEPRMSTQLDRATRPTAFKAQQLSIHGPKVLRRAQSIDPLYDLHNAAGARYVRKSALLGEPDHTERDDACRRLVEARALRDKYWGQGFSRGPAAAPTTLKGSGSGSGAVACVAVVDGVCEAKGSLGDRAVPSLGDFLKDFTRLLEITKDGHVRTFSHQRKSVLRDAFSMHCQLNHREEENETRCLPRDFFTVAKARATVEKKNSGKRWK